MTQALLPTLDGRRTAELLKELGREARRYRFEVAPNPCVGAAVLAEDQVIARGYHQVWGGPHAERSALSNAERSGIAASRWDTLVCTLEPCSTIGKTGACTEAILRTGIRRVVVGALDPDARHEGRGLELLANAGIEVQLVRGASPLEEVSPFFVGWTSAERVRRPRPWTIAKWAQTHSGQLTPAAAQEASSPANRSAGPRWISSDVSREEVHHLRGRVDAIVTGIGTVLTDDPRLTVRAPGNVAANPLRVVLDSVLRTPTTARILQPVGAGEGGGAVHILAAAGASPVRHRALLETGAHIRDLRGDEGHVSLREVQTWLWQQGVRRVLLEAGPTLTAAYLAAGFVDQVRVYTGEQRGGEGPSLGEHLSPRRLLERHDRESGPDAVLEAFFEN